MIGQKVIKLKGLVQTILLSTMNFIHGMNHQPNLYLLFSVYLGYVVQLHYHV